jgi:hypothetical protein
MNLLNLLFFNDVLILLALCTHPRSKRLLLHAKDALKEHLNLTNLLNLMNLLFSNDILILLALRTHPRSKRILLPAKDALKEHLKLTNLLNLMNLLIFHDVLILLALCTHPRSKRQLLYFLQKTRQRSTWFHRESSSQIRFEKKPWHRWLAQRFKNNFEGIECRNFI